MPLSTTKKPSPNLGHKTSTAKASRELKSTSVSNIDHGHHCEQKALRYFLNQGFQLHRRNHRVAGVEVDLILKKDFWLLVEVKSIRDLSNVPFRLTRRQALRLQRARETWMSWSHAPTALQVAFVSEDQIMVLDIEDFEIQR